MTSTTWERIAQVSTLGLGALVLPPICFAQERSSPIDPKSATDVHPRGYPANIKMISVKEAMGPKIEGLNLEMPYEPSPLVLKLIDLEVQHRGFTKEDADRALELLKKVREEFRAYLIEHNITYQIDLASVINKSFDTVFPFTFKHQDSFINTLLLKEGDCDTISFIVYDMLHSLGANPKLKTVLPSKNSNEGHVFIDLGVSKESPYFYDAVWREGGWTPPCMRELFKDAQMYDASLENHEAQLLFEASFHALTPEEGRRLLKAALQVDPNHMLAALALGEESREILGDKKQPLTDQDAQMFLHIAQPMLEEFAQDAHARTLEDIARHDALISKLKIIGTGGSVIMGLLIGSTRLRRR